LRKGAEKKKKKKENQAAFQQHHSFFTCSIGFYGCLTNKERGVGGKKEGKKEGGRYWPLFIFYHPMRMRLGEKQGGRGGFRNRGDRKRKRR